ncbi:hypothetical protein [Rhodococcus sp. NPDC004095]
MNRRIIFMAAAPIVAVAITSCASGETTSGTAAAQSTASAPRATTATMSPEGTLDRLIGQFDQNGLPHQGAQWLQERAAEVCADWEKIGGERGFQYTALGQLKYYGHDLALAAPATTYLTQYGCPRWVKYIN